MIQKPEKGTQKSRLQELKYGETVLELKGITKRFPGVLANDHIDFDVKAGEIHALLGANGAGKTTLMKILYGLCSPNEGEIYIRGEKVNIRSPLDAINMGIGMIPQNIKLISAHTVIENIILGHHRVGRVPNIEKAKEEVSKVCEKYGFKVDFDAKIWQLSAGVKQIVEILKTLYRGAKLLILDEPTSVLTPLETEQFLKSLCVLAKDEFAVIPFITHKLPVVLEISNRVTVLRNGKVVDTNETKNMTEQSLARKMIGREVLFKLERPQVEVGKSILQVQNLSALNDKGILALKHITFSLRESEIFGIIGVAGNGQEELAEILVGLRKPLEGKIIFQDYEITNSSVRQRQKLGIQHIPSNRMEASIGDFSLADNMAMSLYLESGYSSHGILDNERIHKTTEEVIRQFNIQASSVDVRAEHLSGGNLQKLIVARAFSRKCNLLIANLPTYGLDVGASESVLKRFLDAKKEKTSILLISDDLDEVLSMCDRIAPIYEGEFVSILDTIKANRCEVSAMMAGVRQETTHPAYACSS